MKPLGGSHTAASPPGPAAEGAANVAAARALTASLVDDGLVVFMSPGSRNTPLAVAFDELAGARGVATHMLLDERAAAFAALGAARASREPAVVVCTSGTAGGHFLPALMEADRGRVPLIAITADRPPELHHCGAPQTIAQGQLFGGYVRWATTLPTPRDVGDERDLRYIAGMGMRARVAALGSPPGPVHINAPFRKPLYGGSAPTPAATTPSASFGRRRLDDGALRGLERRLSHVEQGVIHVGPLPATTDARALGEAVSALALGLGWPLLVDGASGIAHVEAIRHGEILARSAVIPDAMLALRIGGAPTNAQLGAWLGKLPSILVDPDGEYLDPEARCDTLLVADPIATCHDLAALVEGATAPEWTERWLTLDRAAARAIAACDVDVAGIAAARAVTAIGGDRRVHVASSMAVRDVDAFANALSPIRLTHNRGVNGIDGTVATALGIACATGEPTTALLGDLALVHDVGGLLAACRTDVSLTLVVVNNSGGSIFEMLPIADQIDRAAFERLFATPQHHDLGALATAAGASHAVVAPAELAGALPPAGAGVRVLELRQDRDEERRARAALWTHLAAALQTEARR